MWKMPLFLEKHGDVGKKEGLRRAKHHGSQSALGRKPSGTAELEIPRGRGWFGLGLRFFGWVKNVAPAGWGCASVFFAGGRVQSGQGTGQPSLASSVG